MPRSSLLSLRLLPASTLLAAGIASGAVAGDDDSAINVLESTGETDVTSDRVGELVMEGLKGLDAVAYVRYASVYKDFHKVEDFREFITDEHLTASKGVSADDDE